MPRRRDAEEGKSEDRRWRMEDGEERGDAFAPSSILDPRSSIFRSRTTAFRRGIDPGRVRERGRIPANGLFRHRRGVAVALVQRAEDQPVA